MELRTAKRADEAESADEARQLLDTDGALTAATSIEVRAAGPHDSLNSLSFGWHRQSATLSVRASDELAATALINKAVAILDAGAVDSGALSLDVGATEPRALGAVELTELRLARRRFVGTYADVGRLIRDLTDQVRQVRQMTGSLDHVYIALTEPGRTITIGHLDDLSQITDRDVRQLRHLSISLGSKRDGPSLSLYIGRRTIGGHVDGPDEPSVRSLRAAADDLLRDRSPSPHWLNMHWLMGTGGALATASVVLSLLMHVWEISAAMTLVAFVLSVAWLYLPDIELLREGEKTRWAKSWRYILLSLLVPTALAVIREVLTR